MGTLVKKAGILFLLLMVGALVWYIFIPYIRETDNQTLETRISAEALSENKHSLGVSLGTTTINVDLAITTEERNQGLGGRESLRDDQGMLFIFDHPDYYGFWMKDMLFSLDIAWLDENFRVVHIEKNVSPDTYPQSFKPDVPSKYVLEVNGGFFDARGLSEGSVLYLNEKSDL